VSFSGPPGSVVVPEGTDVRELVRDWDSSPPAHRTATLRVRTGAGHGLRRGALAERPDSDGWDEVQVLFHDLGWHADYLASFGADVIALDPPDLREAVIRRLKGVPQ
jgi:proteasome accessory factor B